MDQTFTKQVIVFLNDRKRTLEETVLHIDKTIAFLSGTAIKQSVTSTLSDNEVQQTVGYQQKVHPKLTPESFFSPKFKLDKKIAYALTKIEKGFKDDVVAQLHTLEPEIGPYRLEKAVAVRLSYLLKIGAIQGKKIGRRYMYSLFK